MPDAVMLFAAGFGTRMGDLTAHRPKPLINVAGRPLLDHALDLTTGVQTRVVNAHYHADQIVSYLADRDIAVSVELPEILDTGGGLKQALPLLDKTPVFTLNTDAVWSDTRALSILAKAWKPDRMDALLLCVPMGRAVGRRGGGDFTLAANGAITWGGDVVYTGAQIMKTDRLAEIQRTAFSLRDVWQAMAEDGRLFGTTYPGFWCDVGHPEGIVLAEEMLARV